MAMRVRGETVEEMAAAARAMRARMNRITAPEGAIDIVGTGGDGKGTLNISTAAALVVAGAGCRWPSTATATCPRNPAAPMR